MVARELLNSWKMGKFQAFLHVWLETLPKVHNARYISMSRLAFDKTLVRFSMKNTGNKFVISFDPWCQQRYSSLILMRPEWKFLAFLTSTEFKPPLSKFDKMALAEEREIAKLTRLKKERTPCCSVSL